MCLLRLIQGKCTETIKIMNRISLLAQINLIKKIVTMEVVNNSQIRFSFVTS